MVSILLRVFHFWSVGSLLYSGAQAGDEVNMLDSGKMVGFVSMQDYDKARAFYEGKRGFDFVSQDQFALGMSVRGHQVRMGEKRRFLPDCWALSLTGKWATSKRHLPGSRTAA